MIFLVQLPIISGVELQNKVDGVDGYKYKVEEGVMANGTFNANNSCFNPYPDLLVDLPIDCTSDVDCTTDPPVFHPLDGAVNHFLPNGLLNTTTCSTAKFGAFPTYVSQPHFYLADPNLLDQFHPDSDLVPDEELHSSYLILHPETGTPLEIVLRTQINAFYRFESFFLSVLRFDLFRPFTGFPIHMFEDVEPTFYPAIWLETVTKQHLPTSTSPPPTSITPTPGPGCSGVPLQFNVASSNFAGSEIVCYEGDDKNIGTAWLPDDETMVRLDKGRWR